jgi:hypothetical protein
MKASEEKDAPVNLAHLPAITQATSAAIGSVISNAIVYPLDLVGTPSLVIIYSTIQLNS